MEPLPCVTMFTRNMGAKTLPRRRHRVRRSVPCRIDWSHREGLWYHVIITRLQHWFEEHYRPPSRFETQMAPKVVGSNTISINLSVNNNLSSSRLPWETSQTGTSEQPCHSELPVAPSFLWQGCARSFHSGLSLFASHLVYGLGFRSSRWSSRGPKP